MEYYANSENNHQLLNSYHIPHHKHDPPKVEVFFSKELMLHDAGVSPTWRVDNNSLIYPAV